MNKFLKLLYKIGFFEFVFHTYAIIWLISHRKPKEIDGKTILNIFYLNFLRIPPKNCEVIKMTKDTLITRCNNRCPILDLSEKLNLDTRKSCEKISAPACKFFLKKLDKRIIFKRNYEFIRPYQASCEETITIRE